jgi:hypothetical protein
MMHVDAPLKSYQEHYPNSIKKMQCQKEEKKRNVSADAQPAAQTPAKPPGVPQNVQAR